MHYSPRMTMIVTVACVLALLLVTPAAAASPQPATGVKAFKDCVIYQLKILPVAKSYTPEMYQQLERILDDAGKSMLTVPKDPYSAALLLGAKIGKFIAFDFVWWVGIMQICLPKLADRSTAAIIPARERLIL